MMAYMKWVALLRDAVREQHASGRLGILAAETKLQEYRLRDWATKNTIDDLSHQEMMTLHQHLSEQVNVGSQHSEVNNRAETAACSVQVSASDVSPQRDILFDTSD